MISTPRPFRRVAVALAALIVASASNAQPPAGPPPGVEPSQPVIPASMFAVPDDLEVTLWAQSPMLRNPSNIDIDVNGRVWVTEAVNYRKLAGKDPDGDRVVILEDTDGDGK